MKTGTPGAVSLTVSIVLHNSDPRLLSAALQSLRLAAQRAHRSEYLSRMDLVLVDNASEPRARESAQALVRSWEPPLEGGIQWLEAQNRGFGAGNNRALEVVDGDVHLVLNPDVELAADALCAGLRWLREAPDDVLVSPYVIGPDGRQEFLCKAYPSVWVLWLRGFAPGCLRRRFSGAIEAYELRRECSAGEPCEVTLASGCCMLVRAEPLRAAGGFDPGFFLYFEDFDLSLRLASRGRLRYVPQMQIVHHGGYAARKGWRHVSLFLRSAVRFFRLHGWRWI